MRRGHDAFEVMSRIPAVPWLALGGALRAPLRQEVPRLDRMEPAAISAPFTAIVVPLVRLRYESLRIVFAKTMASGTPIVSRPTGATQMLMCRSAPPTAHVSSSRHPGPFVVGVRAIVGDLEAARACTVEFERRPVAEQLSSRTWKAWVNGILHDMLGNN
jgi:hypothetical protein